MSSWKAACTWRDTVRKIVRAGIPVMGHIGLTPQSASALGGFKVQGRTPEQAEALIADARALDEAGVFAMVLECIPAGVAKAITASVGASTIGCGAGPHVDGHNLNGYDLLGMFDQFVPKFVQAVQGPGPRDPGRLPILYRRRPLGRVSGAGAVLSWAGARFASSIRQTRSRRRTKDERRRG